MAELISKLCRILQRYICIQYLRSWHVWRKVR